MRFALLLLAFSAGPAFACDRASFGGWNQSDYKDTRFRVLEAQATGTVETRETEGRGALVLSGTWTDPYTGKIMENAPADAMDIDHIVPVCWAWEHGADTWSAAKRDAFYNDTEFLVAVEAGLNRQKGAKGLAEFVPLNRAFACTYAARFTSAIDRYDMQVSPTELARILDVALAACGDDPVQRAAILGLFPVEDDAVSVSPKPAPRP